MKILSITVFWMVLILFANCASRSTPVGDFGALEKLLVNEKWIISKLDDRLDDFVSITMTLVTTDMGVRTNQKRQTDEVQLFVTTSNPRFIYCKSKRLNLNHAAWVKYHLKGDEMGRVIRHISAMPSHALTSREQVLARKFTEIIKSF